MARVQLLAAQLGLALCAIGVIVGLLFLLELDLLATFILAVYSSVFVALALLALHFGPFWSPAVVRATLVGRSLRVVLYAAFILASLLTSTAWAYTSGSISTIATVNCLYQDLYAEHPESLTSATGVLHWLFYRLLVVETIGLNVYLFLGLTGTLTFVYLRAAWLDAAHLSVLALQGGRRPNALADAGMRTRVVARLRRQTRRTNATQLRFK